MTDVVRYQYPTTAEIRGRMKLARGIGFNPLMGVFFVSEAEQGLFHTARRLYDALQAALCDLDLYVGKEPTLSEEALHEHEEAVRRRIAQDLNRAGRPEFPTGERPDLIVATTRAIDIRLIADGPAAPYWVPEGGDSRG